jgi:hypothetical protein
MGFLKNLVATCRAAQMAVIHRGAMAKQRWPHANFQAFLPLNPYLSSAWRSLFYFSGMAMGWGLQHERYPASSDHGAWQRCPDKLCKEDMDVIIFFNFRNF